MKIANIDLKQYELPLTRKLSIKGHTLNKRCGVILTITNSTGQVGYGEAAPLPGLHKESLNEVISELLRLKDDLPGKEIPENALQNISPAARLAVEMAIFDLSVQQDSSFINPANANVPINALLTNQTENVEAEVAQLIEQGYPAIKLKVARNPVDEDIALIRKIKQIAEDKAILRLDANRGWEIDQAMRFCSEIGPEQIEYIEEPVKNIADQAEFIDRSNIPIALDETLTQNGLKHITDIKQIKAFILKPSVLGGLEQTKRFINIAKQNNILSVLSSAFETSIAIRSYLCFAVKMGIANTPMGTDTLKWLSEDVLVNRVVISNGKVDVLKMTEQRPALRTEILTDV